MWHLTSKKEEVVNLDTPLCDSPEGHVDGIGGRVITVHGSGELWAVTLHPTPTPTVITVQSL